MAESHRRLIARNFSERAAQGDSRQICLGETRIFLGISID